MVAAAGREGAGTFSCSERGCRSCWRRRKKKIVKMSTTKTKKENSTQSQNDGTSDTSWPSASPSPSAEGWGAARQRCAASPCPLLNSSPAQPPGGTAGPGEASCRTPPVGSPVRRRASRARWPGRKSWGGMYDPAGEWRRPAGHATRRQQGLLRGPEEHSSRGRRSRVRWRRRRAEVPGRWQASRGFASAPSCKAEAGGL